MADLILSTNKSFSNSSLIKVRQDDYGQTISAIITDKMNSPLDLSTVKITLKIKDWNSDIFSDSSPTGDSDGNVTYTINKNEKLVSGAAWFELDDGDKRLSTQTFWLKVMEASEQVVEMADPLGGVTTIE